MVLGPIVAGVFAAAFGYRGAIIGIGGDRRGMHHPVRGHDEPVEKRTRPAEEQGCMKRSTLLAFSMTCAALGLSFVQGPARAQDASVTGTPYRIFSVVWRGETEVEEGFAITSPSAASRSR